MKEVQEDTEEQKESLGPLVPQVLQEPQVQLVLKEKKVTKD